MRIYIDDLSNYYELAKSLSAKATDIYHTYQQKKYRYLGAQELRFGCCALLLRVLLLVSISMAIMCTLGLVLLDASVRAITNRICRQLRTKKCRICYYGLNNLENWCFLKWDNGKKKLDDTFSIKKFWNEELRKQWWEGKISSKDIYAIHNKMIAGRDLPPLIREIEVPFNDLISQTASMPGISLLANLLSQKTKQPHMHVCKNLSAFQKKLEEIKNQEKDQRLFLITPVHFSLVNPDKKAENEVHKVSVGIEKQEGKYKVCVLDSTPYVVNPTQIHLEPGNFSSQDLIFSYIKAAKLPEDTEYYTPYVVLNSDGSTKEGNRQFAIEGGCSTFSLRDGIAFLRDSRFFTNLSLAEGKGTLTEPFLYNSLPPNFMKTIQSWTILNRYASHNKDLIKTPLGKSPRNFVQTMERHKMEVNGKLQNWLVSRRLLKYQLTLLFMMNHYSDEELNSMIKQRLIT
jgi:hypothetical protein